MTAEEWMLEMEDLLDFGSGAWGGEILVFCGWSHETRFLARERLAKERWWVSTIIHYRKYCGDADFVAGRTAGSSLKSLANGIIRSKNA